MPIDPELTAHLQRRLLAARAEALSLPVSVPLSLFLINRDFSRAALSREEMLAVMDSPPYWSFCWASGLVLADWLLANPAAVRGKRVLDFGCGSGVVAIAAALAGARQVIACDNDPEALAATAANARLNGVTLSLVEDFEAVAGPLDLIIVADVLYDRENLPWLGRFVERAPAVLVADSRVRNFDYPPYRLLARAEGSTLPDMDEFDEFRDVRIYAAGNAFNGEHNDG